MAVNLQWYWPNGWIFFGKHFIHHSRIDRIFKQVFETNIWIETSAIWNIKIKM
jgi:hypothetical protein